MSVAEFVVTKSRVGRRSKDPTAVIRVKRDLADKLSQVCTRRKASMADMLDPIIRPFIESEYTKMAQELANELRGTNGHSKRKPKE